MGHLQLLFHKIVRDWRKLGKRKRPVHPSLVPASASSVDIAKSARFLYFFGVPGIICFGYTLFVEWMLGVELPLSVSLGAGARLFHGQGLVVNPGAVIGQDCILRHGTTIGNKILADGRFTGSPVIGDRVEIGAHVVIIGPLKIGNDAVIGAGSIVTRDVPAGAVVAGNPARVIQNGADIDSAAQRESRSFAPIVHSE